MVTVFAVAEDTPFHPTVKYFSPAMISDLVLTTCSVFHRRLVFWYLSLRIHILKRYRGV